MLYNNCKALVCLSLNVTMVKKKKIYIYNEMFHLSVYNSISVQLFFFFLLSFQQNERIFCQFYIRSSIHFLVLNLCLSGAQVKIFFFFFLLFRFILTFCAKNMQTKQSNVGFSTILSSAINLNEYSFSHRSLVIHCRGVSVCYRFLFFFISSVMVRWRQRKFSSILYIQPNTFSIYITFLDSLLLLLLLSPPLSLCRENCSHSQRNRS